MIAMDSPILNLAVMVCLGFLMLGLVFGLIRLVLGPTLADRVVALDYVTFIAVGFMAAFSLATNRPTFLDVAIALALVGFLATVAFARYAEVRAARGEGLEDLDD